MSKPNKNEAKPAKLVPVPVQKPDPNANVGNMPIVPDGTDGPERVTERLDENRVRTVRTVRPSKSLPRRVMATTYDFTGMDMATLQEYALSTAVIDVQRRYREARAAEGVAADNASRWDTVAVAELANAERRKADPKTRVLSGFNAMSPADQAEMLKLLAAKTTK